MEANMCAILDKAVEVIEDNGECLIFLRLGGVPYPIGSTYSGEDRQELGKKYKERLQNGLQSFYEEMRKAEWNNSIEQSREFLRVDG